ncbi:MAG: tetratricopeptide repeat protein, partial [Nitrospinaceae bacterium]|nr:tetratricopeptide repeat protein [Nitrospinaceae bacterium]
MRNWVREEKYEKALDVLESKTQAQPQSGTPVILKGMVLIEQGNYKEALRALMEGQQRELRHPALHFGFCQVYRHLGQADPSERACHITVQQHPGAPETHYELAQTLAARGKMRQAAKALKKAIDLNPEDPQYPYEL